MTSEAHDLDLRWASLPRPTGALLEAERVAYWAGGRVLVAVDADERRHLLIAIPPEVAIARIRPLRGLAAHNRRMRIQGEEGLWIDLELNDVRGARSFASLCADLLDALSGAPTPDGSLVADVVERWRRFWATAQDGLSHEDTLGLFGELWLLLEWLPALTARSVLAWRGPLGGRHDFVSSALSVEVKTTGTSTGPITHRISSLAQLDEPGEGALYLLSLRMVPDPLGHYSLDGLVERTRQAAQVLGGNAADQIDERLGAYGWSPADVGRYGDRIQVASQQLFEVRDSFPRLTPASFAENLPDGVQDVTYTLDTSACGSWLVARGPTQDGPLTALA